MPVPFRSALLRPWLLLLLFLSLSAHGQNFPDFSATPTLVQGTALQQGAVYRFPNVLPGVDARVTLTTLNNITTLNTLDNNTIFPERLQPIIQCNATANTTCYVRFDIQFVLAGTTTPSSRRGLVSTAQDVDGSDGTGTAGIREFVEFAGATSVTLANPTLLTAATPAFAGGSRFIQSSSANVQAGIGTDNRYEVYAAYPNNTSTVTIVGGATLGATGCNPATTNSCNRLNSYTFSPSDANLPSVTVRKISNGGVGTFAFTGTNGFDAESITTATAGAAVAAQSQALAAAGTATTITETAPPAGFQLAGIACSGLSVGGTATPSIAGNGGNGGSVTLDAAATALVAGVAPNIVCDFTNTRLPTVTLTKVSNGGVGTFSFAGSNGFAAQNITTAAAGTGVAGATQTLTAASTATTLTETVPPAGFVLTAIACTGLGAGGTATPDLATRTVSLNAAATAPGSNIACTFTNGLQADLAITKSNGTATSVSGTSTTYSVVVTNNGAATISGAVVRDTPSVGLTCPLSNTITCTPAAACPAGATVSALTSASGLTLNTIAAGASVTLQFACTVD